jgi:hypothetical protein
MDILEDMQQEQQHEQEPQKQEKEYFLPDGFGMSLDEVRALILNKYDIKVDKDDPILLIVPILNACLNEQQKLQEEYKEGLENVYQQVLNNFLTELDKHLQNSGVQKVEVTHKEENQKGNFKPVLGLYLIIVILCLLLFGQHFSNLLGHFYG